MPTKLSFLLIYVMGISEAEAFSERFKRELQALEPANVHAMYRIEGGIPPLLELLEFSDTKVQRAATGALRTLEFKVDENKNQIVECNALPTLILMLRYIHYEAVGVIKNLVHSCFIANEIGEGANQGEYDASVV